MENINIGDLYTKLSGNECGVGQVMVSSLWCEDKNPSMSINTFDGVFFDKTSGIQGTKFNMVAGKNGKLPEKEKNEVILKLRRLFGDNYISPRQNKVAVKKTTYDESEAWDFTFAWNEMRQAMIEGFRSNTQIRAMLRNYFGFKLNINKIEKIVNEHNIGWCEDKDVNRLAIPYICNDKVTYIDLIHWQEVDGRYSKKIICAYPSKTLVTKHQHLNQKNIGFENANEMRKLSNIKIASRIKVSSGRGCNDTEGQPVIEAIIKDLDQPLFICEGYKDALLATCKNLTALSFSGGANSLKSFKSESIIEQLKKRSSIGIVFDNDQAGRNGARNLKEILNDRGVSNVNIVDLSDVCTEKGEDLADYFLKYKGDNNTLIQRAKGDA